MNKQFKDSSYIGFFCEIDFVVRFRGTKFFFLFLKYLANSKTSLMINAPFLFLALEPFFHYQKTDINQEKRSQNNARTETKQKLQQ